VADVVLCKNGSEEIIVVDFGSRERVRKLLNFHILFGSFLFVLAASTSVQNKAGDDRN